MQIDKRVDTKAANDASNGKFELKMQKLWEIYTHSNTKGIYGDGWILK